MAEEGNAYIIALDNLQEYENDLREAFMNVAGESDQIGIESFPELLDNVSSLLGFDCENAKIFFSWDNTELPENYDLNAIDFIQFYDLFGLWLHKESLNYPTTAPGTNQIGGHEPDFSVTLSKDNITSRSTPGVETNMTIMKELVKQSQDKFESLFNEYIQEEGQERVTVEACYDFLIECLRSSQIELKEKVKSIKDSYKNLDSSQKFLEIAEKYFLEEKKLDSDDFDINEQTLSFKECFEILDFWLRNDENVVLLDKRKKTRGAGITAALKETIEKYEKMIQETQDENEKEVLETTIETLKAQLRDLENGMGKRSKSVKDGLDYQRMEEKRFKALKEIFDVYCLLQLNLGKMGTFAKYERVSNTITLGTFKVILKDFRLKISHLKVVELFNKTTMTDENMSFDEFTEFLTKIALRVEIVTEERVHQPNPEIRKEYRPDCYKKDNTYKIFKENEAKKKQIFVSINRKERNALLKDHVKRDADKLEEIWEHMGLYDGTYKNWMSLVRTPFHIKDKSSVRLAPESVNYKFKPKTGDSLQEIQRRNEMRKLVKDLKTVEKSFISNFKAASSHSAIRTELSLSKLGGKEDSYSQQRSRTKKSVPNIKKLTMKGVENFQDEDLMKIDDKFNPQEMIQENDEEDDMYLAEYNIHEIKVRQQPEHSTDLKKYDNYGRLKKASKGFAVNGKYGHSKNQESRTNLLDGDGAYPSTYSQYESRNFLTNPKGTPVHSNAPSSIKYTTKGANSIYRPTPMDYSTNMGMKQIRNAAPYVSQDGSVNYTHDYTRNTYNYEYSSGNAPYIAANGYVVPRNQGYGNTQNRIDRIERDAQLKQQQMMDNIMSIQQQQLQKGLKTFRK